MSWTEALFAAAKFLWELAFPPKQPEDVGRIAGRAEAERDHAQAGIRELQAASDAGQEQRRRVAADPGRVRNDTPVVGAARPWNPDEQS